MKYTIVFFISILFTCVVLSAGLAHVFSLPNKIHLSRTDYLISQQAYKGWSLFGFAVIISMLFILLQAFLWRKYRPVFIFSMVAFACLLISQVIFWVYTYPANQQTSNWTYLPDDWISLRNKWEYSHLFAAIADMLAVVFLICAALKSRKPLQ
jgi:hypothetical protein